MHTLNCQKLMDFTEGALVYHLLVNPSFSVPIQVQLNLQLFGYNTVFVILPLYTITMNLK